MGLDFRGIRWRFRDQLERLYWLSVDAWLAMLRRSVKMLDDKTRQDKLQEFSSRLENEHWGVLCISMGQALSAWAKMETSLVGIAGLLLKTSELNKVGIIMYSIVNFNVWLSVIDDLFSQEPLFIQLKPKWNKINNRLRGMKHIRDRLAHHTIYQEEVATFVGSTSLKLARFDITQKSQKYRPLEADNILGFTSAIAEVQEDLTALINSMSDIVKLYIVTRTSQQKSSEPTPDQHQP
jgi:hypothetical protein